MIYTYVHIFNERGHEFQMQVRRFEALQSDIQQL